MAEDEGDWDGEGEGEGEDQNEDGDPVLQLLLVHACNRREAETLALLDAQPALINQGWTGGDLDEAEFTIYPGDKLLMTACAVGPVGFVDALIVRGADVNGKSIYDGWTALMVAASKGFSPVVSLLLNKGAAVDERTVGGETALFRAAEWDYIEAALLLISRSADLMARDEDGRTAMDAYGENMGIGNEVKEDCCARLRAAFAEGPHISQVRRRNWARRAAFVQVLAESDLQPLATRRAELAVLHPPLPPDAAIPRLPCETPAQRRALLRDKVLSHPGLVKHVAAFL